MKLATRLPLLALLLALAACGDAGTADAPPPAEPATPEMVDGVQVVEVTVGPAGYEPAAITLQASVPARLVFTRTVEGDCPSQVQIPAFGVEKTDLPMNEPTAIAFTPTETGTFEFVCGMDMMRGSVLVQS